MTDAHNPVSAVRLYNRHGQSITLGQKSWQALLDVATALGWSGPGSLPPPVHLNLDHSPSLERTPWNGSYSTAHGQEITAEDARAIAAALEHSPSHTHSELIAFLKLGGCLVCPIPNPCSVPPTAPRS